MEKFDIYRDVRAGPGSRVDIVASFESEDVNSALEIYLTEQGYSDYIKEINNGRVRIGNILLYVSKYKG